MQEGQRRGDAAAVEDERGEGRRGGRGGCNDGNRREQSVFPTLHCVHLSSLYFSIYLSLSLSLSRYIRLNCIYAECSRMIYVRGFNTVAHTVRYCYRISRLPRRMTIIRGKLLVPSSFTFLFFFLFSVEPGATLNSHVAAEKISAAAGVTLQPDIFPLNGESFPKSSRQRNLNPGQGTQVSS